MGNAGPAFPLNGGQQGVVTSVAPWDSEAGDGGQAELMALHRGLLDAMDEGCCVVDVIIDASGNPAEYRCIEHNRAFEELSVVSSGIQLRAAELGQDHSWLGVCGTVALTGESTRFEYHAFQLNRWFDVHVFGIGGEGSRRVAAMFKDVTDRKWAELEAERSWCLRLELLGRLPVACYTLDAEGRLTFYNDAAAELWGRRPTIGSEHWCGSFALWSLEGHPVTLDQSPAARAHREGTPIRGVEVFIERPDGTRRHVIPFPDPLFDLDGQCSGLINVLVDVTEQRAMELKLRESEAFLRSIVGATTDCLKVLDLDGRIEWISESGLRLMEITQLPAVHGSFWPDFCQDAPTRKLAWAAVNHAREGGIGRFNGTCLTFAGNPKWWDVIVTPILDADGHPHRLLSVARDVTNVHHVEEALHDTQVALERHAKILESQLEALRVANVQAEMGTMQVAESAERFRVLSEVVALQVWTATPEGTIDYVNQECFEYSGADDPDALLGHGWRRLVHPEDLGNAIQAWKHSSATGQRFQVQVRLRDNQGSYRWFLVRAEALRDRVGKVIKWFGSNTDINDLKQAQAVAECASRAKDDFLATLSHELRTPLTPVLMAAAELKTNVALPQEVREQMGMVERNIELEARLIDDLLDLTTVAKGKLQLRRQLCDVHLLIDRVIEMVKDHAQSQGVVLEREFTAKLSGLVADPTRIHQVMWNLLRNAVKFTPKGGRVLIRTDQVQHADGVTWLGIEVRDTGMGIEGAQLDQIFRPFDQGDLKGGHRFGGLGLGLAIARAVVDVHRGRISAHSAGRNRGSCFKVELPGAVAPPPPAGGRTRTESPSNPRADQPAAPSVPRPLRLLVVEDDTTTLGTLRWLLERDGHRLVTATDVESALEAAAAEPFDLVLSDIGLPDGSGIDLMKKLRALYGLSGVALSGYGMEEDVARSRAAGFLAHVVKPVQIAELRRVIASLSPSAA